MTKNNVCCTALIDMLNIKVVKTKGIHLHLQIGNIMLSRVSKGHNDNTENECAEFNTSNSILTLSRLKT